MARKVVYQRETAYAILKIRVVCNFNIDGIFYVLLIVFKGHSHLMIRTEGHGNGVKFTSFFSKATTSVRKCDKFFTISSTLILIQCSHINFNENEDMISGLQIMKEFFHKQILL